LRADEELRSELRSVPVDVEMPFGLPRGRSGEPEPAAEVTLEDGRTIRLRGLIDRLDMRSDGVPVVLDYKTGRASSPAEFERDPVVGGRRLQLGVYAEAAKQRLGTDDAYAYYWFTSSRGGFKHVGYPWTAERRERFTDAVETIVDGIERGDFPPNPGDYNGYYGSFENCSFCSFTRICPVDRDEELEQAIRSNRLVDYVRLHEIPPETAEDSDEGEVPS
jgi:ATP-dependent helicase/DNAse subunit B